MRRQSGRGLRGPLPRSLPALVLGGLIRGYQLLVSPVLPASCRFVPTCSEYAREAIARYGALRGGWLAVRRLLRCHPWGGAGYDPVPDPVSVPGAAPGAAVSGGATGPSRRHRQAREDRVHG